MIGGSRLAGVPAGAFVALAVAIGVSAGSASADASSWAKQDRAATNAYLAAKYAYVQALVAVAPARLGALEGAVGRLGSECAGVLANAPRESGPEINLGGPRQSARQGGEAKRERSQLDDLRGEAEAVAFSAFDEPARPAQRVFVAAIESLRWRDRAVAARVHEEVASIESGFQAGVPEACADMRAWVASGYKRLSDASRARVQAQEAVLVRSLRSLLAGARPLTLTVDALLRPHEGPAERALSHRILALQLQMAKSLLALLPAGKRLDAALGVASREHEPEVHETPRKGSVKIASGKTAAGGRYTVWAQPKPRGAEEEGEDCQASVAVMEEEGSSGDCLSAHEYAPEPIGVRCEEGLLRLEGQTLGATRLVRLRLSDGREIDSRPAIVPKRFGGPAGLYFQVLRGPAPIPVSLVEVGARGKTLRVLKLRRIVECTEHPLKYLAGGPHTLVRGSAPNGPPFAIVAERYRLYGQVSFEIRLETGVGVLLPGGRDAFAGLASEGPIEGRRALERKPFEQHLETGCHPYEYAILYGLLAKPRDTVLVRIAGKLRPLSRVRIPGSLRVHGVLAYAALAAVPEELVVRSPRGAIVQREDLRKQAHETRETCEGESEGPGPTVGGAAGGGLLAALAIASELG